MDDLRVPVHAGAGTFRGGWLSGAQKKAGPERARLVKPFVSDYDDIFGLGAFLPLRDREFDLLAFDQRFESVTCDVAEMGKYVRAGFLREEAKAF